MENARKIKLCLYVKQNVVPHHTPAVYNVNYLLNKRKCLVNGVALLSLLLPEHFLKFTRFLATICSVSPPPAGQMQG